MILSSLKQNIIAIWTIVLVSLPVSAWAMEIQEVTSPGGITAWLVEEHSLPLVMLDATWAGGAILDPDGKRGLTYMMAGLMNEGSGDLEAQAYKGALEELATEIGFDSGYDGLSVSFATLSANRDASVDMLRTALMSPRFDQDAIDRLRQQVAVSLLQDEQNPDRIALRAWYDHALPGHAYAEPRKGTMETIAGFTRADFVSQHGRLLTRDTVKIGVVGDITPDELAAMLDEVFGSLPESGDRRTVEYAQVTPEAALLITDQPNPQSIVYFGHQGLARDDEDFIPAYIMNYVLGGGGFSSRLMEEVREKRGLAYNVGTSLAPKDYAALYVGRVATENERVAETLDVIRAEFSKMAEQGVTAEELENAKTYLTGSYALRFDSNSKIAAQLVAYQLDDLGIDYIVKRNSLINAVTLEEVNAVAARLLQPDRMIVSIVGQPQGVAAN